MGAKSEVFEKPQNKRGFLADERARDKEVKCENFWAHTLGPLNLLIQPEAALEVT